MTTFHRWDDAKHEIFDEEDIAAIDEGATEMVTAATSPDRGTPPERS